MSILLNAKTKVLVQGITGKEGMKAVRAMLDYHTNVVGGVTPKKGGQAVDGKPVFNTVKEAKKATGCNVSMIFVPPPFAADSILEAVDADLDLVICITEGIPVLDMVRVKRYLQGKKRASSAQIAQAS